MNRIKNFTRTYRPQTEIVTDGQTTYLLLIGEVGVYSENRIGRRTHLSTIGPGDYISGHQTDILYIAHMNVIALEINRENAYDFISVVPRAIIGVVKALLTEQPAPPPVVISSSTPSNAASQPAVKETEKQSALTTGNSSGDSGEDDPSQPQENYDNANLLFPCGHGSYSLPLEETDGKLVYAKNLVCPICQCAFQSLAARTYKLACLCTDSDMRVRYKGIEPIYYEIAVCPDCLYSAQIKTFSKGTKSPEFAKTDLKHLKQMLNLKPGTEPDTNTVFSSYYLAILCAPLCFKNSQLTLANLWMKLCRIYDDCGDEDMSKMAAEKALGSYMYAYEKMHIPFDQEAQLCTMIAEMNYKTGNIKEARDFFFKVKTHSAVSRVLKDHADDRISYLKEVAASAAQL